MKNKKYLIKFNKNIKKDLSSSISSSLKRCEKKLKLAPKIYIGIYHKKKVAKYLNI